MFYEKTLKGFKNASLNLILTMRGCMVGYANHKYWIITQWLRDCDGVQVASCCTIGENL